MKTEVSRLDGLKRIESKSEELKESEKEMHKYFRLLTNTEKEQAKKKRIIEELTRKNTIAQAQYQENTDQL